MPEPWKVVVTTEYETMDAEPFTAVQRVVEALRTGGMPWPVTLEIEVTRDA